MERALFTTDSEYYPPIFLVLCMLAAVGVYSTAWPVELYRCTQDGRVEFRQTPCLEGKQERTVVIEQSSGMTPVEPALSLEQIQEKRTKTKSPIETRRKPNKERCWKTEKKLEKVEQRLRGGYKASQYRDLHRKQNEYEEYLRYFCRS